MKKLITLLVFGTLFLGISNSALAQKDDHGSALNIFVDFGDNTSIKAHYEIGLTPDLTISPVVHMKFGDNSSFGAGARADYYFDRLLKLHDHWDIWAGADAIIHFEGEDNFSMNGHIGGEYLFNDTWGLICEVGFGSLTSGSIGVGIHL